jgi:acyl-CoA thioesterase-1
MRWIILGGFLSVFCGSSVGLARADVGGACPAVPLAPLALPVTKAASEAGRQVVIVALGSSSSRGAGASDPAHSYPSVLQTQLSHLLPTVEMAVINRGNDGEDARQELARLDLDVLALRPTLVIWQVGANGAMRNADPKIFEAMIEKGVGLLHDAGADVILMDNQRAQKILMAPGHVALEAALADAAHVTHTHLFSRGALMDGWRDSGFAYDLFVGPDALHHNDHGYRCLAEALARAITVAVVPQHASR